MIEPYWPDSPEEALWQRNTQESPFLRLPTEIREQIYNFALGDAHIHITYNTTTKLYRSYHLPRNTNPFKKSCSSNNDITDPASTLNKFPPVTLLDRVCRQLYFETAVSVFKLGNIWSFSTPAAMNRFLSSRETLPLSRIQCIRTLFLLCAPDECWWKILKNVQTIYRYGDGGFSRAYDPYSGKRIPSAWERGGWVDSSAPVSKWLRSRERKLANVRWWRVEHCPIQQMGFVEVDGMMEEEKGVEEWKCTSCAATDGGKENSGCSGQA